MYAPRVRRLAKRPAFTLIELLVVISIISLLVGIVLPALSAVRRHGTKMSCQTRMHEIARAIWAYSVSNDNRVPYIVSSLTNTSFGNISTMTDEETNPYDRERWPASLPNVLMPLYLGQDEKMFVCPAAIYGWPKASKGYRFTYRDAGANQPNGSFAAPGDYLRENFGFMDGRPMNELRVHFTGNPITDLQLRSRLRSSYVRDMIKYEGGKAIGPHNGGINVLNREFGVEFRDQKTVQTELAFGAAGVQF